MRVLVVYAHPFPNSFASAVHHHVVSALKAAGHQVDDLDLYAEQFRPVLTLEERERYFQVGANLANVEADASASSAPTSPGELGIFTTEPPGDSSMPLIQIQTCVADH
jgi:putative NADPH-quinone reductase